MSVRAWMDKEGIFKKEVGGVLTEVGRCYGMLVPYVVNVTQDVYGGAVDITDVFYTDESIDGDYIEIGGVLYMVMGKSDWGWVVEYRVKRIR
jgi:hypothetical protein